VSNRPVAPVCRISPSASIETELRRIGRAEVDFALEQVRGVKSKPVRAVHECRKAIKRLRALVRLCSGNADACRAADRTLCDAGRLLAEARDTAVIRRTATDLCADDAPAQSVDLGAQFQAAAPRDKIMRRVAGLLREARSEIDRCFAGAGATHESLGALIERTYRKTGRRMNRFRARDSQKRAHGWRKSVQRYANQLRLMADLWPERTAAELESLEALAKCLGEYNDLTILRGALDEAQIGPDKHWRAAVRRLARSRQRALRARALGLGEPLFQAPGARDAGAGPEPEPEKSSQRWL
jgi:CHAD domain-containing protein